MCAFCGQTKAYYTKPDSPICYKDDSYSKTACAVTYYFGKALDVDILQRAWKKLSFSWKKYK